ncbi:hypothetical protein MTO96_010528 [Rhipicephalus appendiculatus]
MEARRHSRGPPKKNARKIQRPETAVAEMNASRECSQRRIERRSALTRPTGHFLERAPYPVAPAAQAIGPLCARCSPPRAARGMVVLSGVLFRICASFAD